MENATKKLIKKKFACLQKKLEAETYTKFIEGKSVSIVGPSEIVLNREKENEIDSSDCVVRFNNVIDFMPFPSKLRKYIGSRTDILYLAPSEIKKTYNSIQRINTIRNAGVKYIIFQSFFNNGAYISEKKHAKYNDFIHDQKMLSSALNLKIDNVCWGKDVGLELANALSFISSKTILARMGFYAIMDCLIRNAKTITVYGMTFYFGGGHIFRNDCIKELKPDKRHDGHDSVHDSRTELLLFDSLIKDNVSIIYD